MFSEKIIKNHIYIFTFLIGALYTLSFPPFNFKPLIFFSLAAFFYFLSISDRKKSMLISYIYALSIFTTGVSWIFNSIYFYGGEYLVISLFLTILFILLMSAFFIPIGLFINKQSQNVSYLYPIMVPSVWVFIELARSYVFGGFPWLLVGTSQIETLFNVVFPLFGTYFVSFLIVMLSTIITLIINDRKFISLSIKYLISIIGLIIIFQIYPPNLLPHENQKPLRVSLVQPNIHLGIKYDKSKINLIKNKYSDLLDNDMHNLIILPETAIPTLYESDKNFYKNILKNKNTHLITGIFRYNKSNNEIYNSMLSLSDKEYFYDKRHMVPFGEYTPLDFIFGFIGEILNLPMSNLTEGKKIQKPFIFNETSIHQLICYEAAFPSLLNITNDFSFIVNVSNDAWFGNSLAPYQHLQIAQSRALESNKYLVRVANTGISAIIDQNGKIVNKIKLNTEGVINSRILALKGITPYMRFGDYPVLMLIFSIMLFYWNSYKKYG